jgi:ribonuclease BN (tRNA processing enzyme)
MRPDDRRVARRHVLEGFLRLGVLGTVGRLAVPFAAQLAIGTARAEGDALAAPGTHLLLLGTQGGPNFNPTRNETASAVVVDGTTYLIDCGYGALGALRKAGVNFRDIGHVFLSHLHDDHTADLAAFLSHQWTDGRITPTVVIGPYGTKNMVKAALAFSSANTAIRLVDEARSVKPSDIFHGKDIAATTMPLAVYSDDKVRVSSIENTHFPESSKRRMPYRSLAYRFDTANRSIAFSGDTTYSENVVALAKGADVLVCETIELVSERKAFDRAVANGAYADNAEGIWKHIVSTHTSTEDAGRMASEAGVGMLVLNHLVPGALLDTGDAVYVEGVRKHYDGKVVVGKDLMVL